MIHGSRRASGSAGPDRADQPIGQQSAVISRRDARRLRKLRDPEIEIEMSNVLGAS